MTRNSVKSRDLIFVKGYGFLFFARNMGTNVGRNTSEHLSSKYSQKLLHHAKKSTADALESTSEEAIQKTAEATSI